MVFRVTEKMSEKVIVNMRATMAETIMPLWRNLRLEDMREKNPDDWVTAADIAAENRLTPVLKTIIPEACVIGEEACSENPDIRLTGNNGLSWTLDPVDGTRGFRNGSKDFGMLVGLMEDGYPIAGWLLSADGTMMYAINGCADICRSPVQTNATTGRWANSRGKPETDLQKTVEVLINRGHVMSRAVYSVNEYMALARGDTNYNILAHDEAWDHVPGLALVKALGGNIMDLHGNTWNAYRRLGTFACMKPEAEQTVLECLKNFS